MWNLNKGSDNMRAYTMSTKKCSDTLSEPDLQKRSDLL